MPKSSFQRVPKGSLTHERGLMLWKEERPNDLLGEQEEGDFLQLALTVVV